MAAAAILEITETAKSPRQFDRSLRNLLQRGKMGLPTAATVKKLNFQKSKIADGRDFRRVTARCVLSVVILPIATQQRRNYLYDKS